MNDQMKDFTGIQKVLKYVLWFGMWIYALYTFYPSRFYYHLLEKGATWEAFRGIVWGLPLVAVLMEQFFSFKERLLSFGLIVLLRDFIYILTIAIWAHGFANESLTMMTVLATLMFTIIVSVFFLIIYHFTKNHPWILIFVLPFVLSISIGLFHMWTVVIYESSFFS